MLAPGNGPGAPDVEDDIQTTPDPVSPGSPNLLTEPVDYSPAGGSRLLGSPRARRVVAYLLVSALLGLVAGALWNLVVDLPSYTIGEGGAATTTERDITAFFATDAWFCLIGALVGLGLGVLGWRWFRHLGWVSAPLVCLAGLLAGWVCWRLGEAIGPGSFEERIAAAQAGDSVEVQFMLHAPIALLVWPFTAIVPVLLASSLGNEVAGSPSWVRRLNVRSAPDAPQ